MNNQELGQRLIEARSKKGLSLADVGRSSGIPISILQVFEDGTQDQADADSVLVHDIYRRSYFRRYAAEVGLEPELTDDYLGPVVHPPEMTPSSETNSGTRPWNPTWSPAPSPLKSGASPPSPRSRISSRGAPFSLLISLLLLVALTVFIYNFYIKQPVPKAPEKPPSPKAIPVGKPASARKIPDEINPAVSVEPRRMGRDTRGDELPDLGLSPLRSTLD